ncbi:MAG: uroporphyrinogen-III synthase [Magnetococcales bacterium]|nr:uroporphyrinogen-III synthase [Magnetococcales bacterium]
MNQRTILITRPRPEADETARQVQLAGGLPWVEPLLKIVPPDDPALLRQALNRWQDYDGGLIVTSVNGARALLDGLPAGARPLLWAVGDRTAALLRQAGHRVRVPQQAADAALLAEEIMADGHNQRRLLWLAAELAQQGLSERLRAAGWVVDQVVAYRAELVTSWPTEVTDALQQGTINAVLLFSSRTAQALIELLPAPVATALPSPVCVAVLSPAIARVMAQAGRPADVVASRPNSAQLLADLQQYERCH